MFFICSGTLLARSEQATFVLNDFSKGINSHINPYLTPNNAAADAKNVRFNSVYGGFAKRPVMLSYASCGSHAITGLHRLYTSTGTQKLITAGSTFLYVGDDSAGTCNTKIGQGFTSGQRWQFVTYHDVAIGFNGTDQPIKYDGSTNATADTDGHRTASDLVAELGAPFAELDTGTDLDSAAWYAYKIAFYDGTNYYYSDARSNPILTGGSVYNIALTDIPLGPIGTTTRYVFRTEGQADRATLVGLSNSSYKLVASIANNTATTYADSTADGSLSTALNSWISSNSASSVTPPIGHYATIHQERLFVAGDTSAKSTLYYSDLQNPDYFDPNDYELFRPDDGDEIMAIKPFLGILTIFKTNSISKYYTDTAEGTWIVSTSFSDVGTPAPYSVAVTPAGIFYLSWDGIYRFIGQRSEKVSDAVTPQIRNIMEANIGEATGFYYKSEYRLAYTNKSSAGAINNRVLIYDMTRDAYAIDTKEINVFAALGSGTDFGDLYMGSSNTDGTVWIDEGETSSISIGLKSELDSGTYDDSRSYGTERSPIVEIAWDCDIDGWLAELQTKDASINTIDDIGTYLPNATIDRPDTSGSWTSPGYQVNASQLQVLKWNEFLGPYGDITFQVRSASTEAGLSAAVYSSAFTDPSGSSLTALTAGAWVQVKANFSTTNINYTPNLIVRDNYLWRLSYVKGSSSQESDFESYYETGWKDLNPQYPGYEKRIKQIRVFYKGTSGTMTVRYWDDIGDVDASFDIDLSVNDSSDIDGDDWNEYRVTGDDKIYIYLPPANSPSIPDPIGFFWKFSISENGNSEWKIDRIEISYTVEPRNDP